MGEKCAGAPSVVARVACSTAWVPRPPAPQQRMPAAPSRHVTRTLPGSCQWRRMGGASLDDVLEGCSGHAQASVRKDLLVHASTDSIWKQTGAKRTANGRADA